MSDERRATEDLLAGFDRPGRSPRAPSVRVDFNPAAAATGAETVLVTRRRAGRIWPWLVLAFLGSAGIGVVVLLAIFTTKPASPPATAAASTATPATPVVSVAAEPVVPTESAAPHASMSAAPRIAKPPPAPSKKPEEHRNDFVPSL